MPNVELAGMLQHHRCVQRLKRPWRSIRFASQLSHRQTEYKLVKTTATTTAANTESVSKSSSILSRSSDRTQSKFRRGADTESKKSNARVQEVAAHGTPRPRATSFVSTRSAQKRDHAAEKWFADVQELDVSNVGRSDDLKSLPPKRRRSEPPKQHEMRPRTDLNELFATSLARSATSIRIQTRKELGGDYNSYLPDGYVDPHRLPVAYARSVLGRNKHIPLVAQAGALDIIEKAVRGKGIRQVL